MDENMTAEKMPSMSEGVSEGKKEPEVAIQCERIFDQIKILSDAVDKLEVKLQPILRQEPVTDTEPEDEEGEINVPLASLLKSRAYDIYVIQRRVRNLISRVEV